MADVRFPEWLPLWIKNKFYDKYCSIHTKTYETAFCTVCKGALACELCWKKSKEHENHEHIQVCVASGRAAIDTTIIRRFLDVSDIQEYKINHKMVVYLKPNEGGSLGKRGCVPTCKTCERRLMPESRFTFCSINCKICDVEHNDDGAAAGGGGGNGGDGGGAGADGRLNGYYVKDNGPRSFRRFSRKLSTPRRSPLHFLGGLCN